MKEIEIVILVIVILSIVVLFACARIYEIGKFVNGKKIDKIFEANIRIYDFYKDICFRYGATPKKDLPINQMIKESKRIVDESKNEEDTNIYIDKTP